MKYYKTKGTCAKEIGVELTGEGIIEKIEFVGGCDGNTHGIENLIVGSKASDVIKKLRGIDCNGKGTSCPDQLSKILENIIEKNKIQF